MNNIKISFCIPTYNRGETVYNCVKQILKCKRDDIEIVVSDNASTDNTKSLINSIDDKRLKYYSNSKNLGANWNVLKVLGRGQGEFLFITSDEDTVAIESIPLLIDIINKEKDVTLIWGTVANTNGKIGKVRHKRRQLCCYSYSYNKYVDSYSSMSQLLYTHPYLSGQIFKKDSINLSLAEKFHGHNYIFEHLVSQCMIKGTVLTIPNVILYSGPVVDSKLWLINDKSFFHPENRVLQLKARIEISKELAPDDKTLAAIYKTLGNWISLELAVALSRYSINVFAKTFNEVLKIKEIRKTKELYLMFFPHLYRLLLGRIITFFKKYSFFLLIYKFVKQSNE